MDKPKILYVDDDPTVRRSFAAFLRRQFVVEEEADGADAILKLEGGARFGLILSDLEMPGMGGDVLVKWLEQYQPEMAGRVVILSGGAATRERAEWLVGFDAARVLSKPCAPADLLAVIRVVLARPRR